MAKFKCLVCGNPSDSLYCMKHKPRQPLKRSRIKQTVPKNIDKKIKEVELMRDFFSQIWNERPHVCGSCGSKMGNEPFTYYFDHLLEKSKYPELKFKKNNILLVCEPCHSSKTAGRPTEAHNAAINAAKSLFNKY